MVKTVLARLLIGSSNVETVVYRFFRYGPDFWMIHNIIVVTVNYRYFDVLVAVQ